MLRIYGTKKCPDCVECCEAFDRAGVAYVFLEFYEDMKNLKAFLKIRDNSSLFDPVREAGNVGIPCIVDDREQISLDWEAYLK